MSDIVERLRSWTGSPDDSSVVMPQVPVEVLVEAAAEIERLRVERDEARKTMREWSENCGAEVQRLRGLLREAVAIIDGISPYSLGGWAHRVREALGERDG